MRTGKYKIAIIIAILSIVSLSGCVSDQVYSAKPLSGDEIKTIDTVYSMETINGNIVVKIDNDKRQFVLRRENDKIPVNPDMQHALQYSYEKQKRIEIFYTPHKTLPVGDIVGVRYLD